MRKSYKKWMLGALLTAFACSMLAFAACGKDKGEESSPSGSVSTQPGTAGTTSAFELSKTSAEMVLGDELFLIAIYQKTENTPVVWTSSNPAIISVAQDGTVTANDTGEAVITATYGEYSATCKINVGLGDLQPVLVLKSYLGEEVVPFTVGTGYVLNAAVEFNGKEYECEPIVTIDGSETIVYEDGKINATGEGTATVTVSTVWKGMDTALLTTQIRVEALESVFITPFVTFAGSTETVATNNIELSMVGEWCGKQYVTSANVEFKAIISGQESVLTDVEIAEGDDLITYDAATGEIATIENKRGEAKLEATYQSSGKSYVRTLHVNVTCPVEEYNDLFELDTSKNFPVTDIFGSGAKIREAYQGGRDVSPAPGRGQLIGVEEKGSQTEDLLVYTTKGAYLFTNLFCYSMKLTQSNFMKELSLSGRTTPIEGYYVLGENVTVDATTQGDGGASNHFAAIFDGRGYTVNATVDDTGIFGHVGGDAVIKNTHFNFTFKESGYVVGLAKNASITAMESESVKQDDKMEILLENLYITSTNYTNTSYLLMGEIPYFLSMKDIYVNVNVGTPTPKAGSEKALLFHMDRALYMSTPAASHRLTCFKNVHLVTGAFIAMADYWYAQRNYAFTSWANSDLSIIGAKHKVENPAASEYTKLRPLKDETDTEFWAQYGKYYTYDPYGLCMSFGYVNVTRYDTLAQLQTTGITQIGSWTVA